jgi:hypothetical protein
MFLNVAYHLKCLTNPTIGLLSAKFQATSVGKTKLDVLCRDGSASVTSLIQYSKESKCYINFGSGFVLYDDTTKTVILTSAEVFDEGEENIFVCFSM